MTCPRCDADFEYAAVCPECGTRVSRVVSGVLKTSAVLISAGRDREFYGSVQEVPEPLRTQLIQVTAGRNAGTIVIADRAGRERLTEVLGRRHGSGRGALAEASEHRLFLGYSWIAWAGVALGLGALGAIAAVFAIHW